MPEEEKQQEETNESAELEEIQAATTTSTTTTATAPEEPAAKPTTKRAVETVVPFNRLIVLNVAATCDENNGNPSSVQVTKENSEVIELSFVVIDASKMQVVHTEQIYVKPEQTPLTEYCTQVTGITTDTLESAGTLQNAINQLDDYIQREIEAHKLSFCFVTHGGWTLRIQLPREARDKNIDLPPYLSFCRMFDLKQEIQRWQVHHREVSVRSMALKDLCDTFHVDRVTDRSAGLNTCLTTVNVIRYLTDFGHPDVFVHAIDTNADLQQFKKEESKVVHLAGLPFEVTQGELEAWFSSNGLRPTATYMIQASDFSKPNLSGFVVFHAHNDAMRALSLNGRCLGDRAVEVSPSSERVIEAAGSMLVPFPAHPKARPLRPGDWNCPSCSFHNFASRRSCFKCNTENPNAPQQSSHTPAMPTPMPPPVANPPNFTPGDWMCPNYQCSFHNYASRVQCLKCGTYRPQHGSAAPAPPPSTSYGRPPITFRPGDWYCPNPACGFQNFASRASCFRCQTPNPNPTQRPPYPPAQPSYGYDSNYGYGQSGYQQHQPPAANSNYGYGPPSGANAPFRPGDWYW
ncbi:ribonuclease H-like domain-containing protein [Fennellomyces sp. T-0311]|nr:ribonuclease H-like domain-containing protein [Fennellomyces sp. T-0311]